MGRTETVRIAASRSSVAMTTLAHPLVDGLMNSFSCGCSPYHTRGRVKLAEGVTSMPLRLWLRCMFEIVGAVMPAAFETLHLVGSGIPAVKRA